LIWAPIAVGVGGLLLCNGLYWRLRAQRVSGTVIGVRRGPSGKTYHAVYRYADALGRAVEATSTGGSARLQDKRTGSMVHLLVFADRPQTIREANSYIVEIAGAIFLGLGLWAWHLAVPAWSVGRITWIMIALGLVGAVLWRYRPAQTSMPADFASGELAKRAFARSETPVQRAEDILATPQAVQRSARNRPLLFVVMGFAMIGGGILAVRSTARLESAGLSASGTVVELHESPAGKGSGTYHPVVRFMTANGASAQFEDGSGSNPPSYRVGEQVRVRYLANTPARSAIIDRGTWNWAGPLVLGLAGVLCAVFGFSGLFSVRRTS
jgi:hypothetical protein